MIRRSDAKVDWTIRAARPGEADALSALCLRSKAHWGYDDDFLERCRAELTVEPKAISAGWVWVVADKADTPQGTPMGIGAVNLDANPISLDLLFVDPVAIGTGAGKALLEAISEHLRGRGYDRLTIDSDPFAEAFYLRMGAVRAGESPSGAAPGRMLPRMILSL